MSTTVHVPEDLADRLAAEAVRRGLSVDELSAVIMPAARTGPAQDQSSPKLTETSTGPAPIAASSSVGSRRTTQSMRPIPKLTPASFG